MKTSKVQPVYFSDMDIHKKTALPFFTVVFFASLVFYSLAATLMIHAKSWMSYGVSFAGAILLANFTVLLAAIAYHYLAKDESY